MYGMGVHSCTVGVIWVSYGCVMGVIWVSYGCIMGVIWVSIWCRMGVVWRDGCQLSVHALALYRLV